MNNKASLQALVVNASALLDNTATLDEFNQHRFYITAPNAMLVSISGSSESKMFSSPAQQVIDASYLQCDDKLNISLATADGLGESEDDPSDNQNNAAVSAFCAQALCQQLPSLSKEQLVAAVKQIAIQSKSRNTLSSDGLPYEARTAIHALLYHAETGLAHVIGVGDVLTVVFDGKTGALKYQQNARVYKQGKAIWAPLDLQLLASAKPQVVVFAEQALQINTWQLADDDIIVQMSDGIWSEFPTINEEIQEGDVTYIETQLAFKNIKEIDEDRLAACNLKSSQALDIALIFQNKTMSHFREKLVAFSRIHPELSKKLASEATTSKTMAEFITGLSPELAEAFKQLFVNEQHDAMPYHPDMPVSLFSQYYRKISFGDCATLSVFKIPSAYQRMLIFMLQSMPLLSKDEHESHVKSLSQLSEGEIAHLFHQLSQQQFIPEERITLSLQNLAQAVSPAYNCETLAALKKFILNYKQYQKVVDAQTEPGLKRAAGLNHIQSISTVSERRFLAHYLDQLINCNVSDYIQHFIFKPSNGGITIPEYKDQLHHIARER